MAKHHKFSHAHHTFHKDGSITSHLVHEDGPAHDVHSAHSDHDAMMDHMMDHTSAPNPGEGATVPPAEGGAAPAAPGGAPAPAGM